MINTNHAKKAGFTLIELLVVLVIISIVASVALLTINRGENRTVKNFANELTQMLTLAQEQALLKSTIIGIFFDHHSIRFTHYQPATSDRRASWLSLDDRLLDQKNIPSGVEVDVRTDLDMEEGKPEALTNADDEEQKSPQIVISTSGDVTPFTIFIGIKGKSARYSIKGTPDGQITTQAIN